MQTINAKDPDNHTIMQYHKYHGTQGVQWKEGINRVTAHTDESLMTLLLNSPSAVLSL